MPVPEPLSGLRVVATPEALDAAAWRGEDVAVLRFAPDEAFAIGATGVDLRDPDAIVEREAGFVGVPVDLGEVKRHIEWRIPSERPALAQGSIGGVPAKLWIPTDDGAAVLLVLAAYADDLLDRLR